MTSATNATYWHDVYRQSANATDEFLGELLALLPGAQDEGADAYDQIPRAIKALTADRDRAREVAVALEQELARVQDLHSPFRIYDDCCHEHKETDKNVTNVAEIGIVCEDGYMYTVCRHCCTDAQGFQTEACISSHDHSDTGNRDGICPTRRAINGTV